MEYSRVFKILEFTIFTLWLLDSLVFIVFEGSVTVKAQNSDIARHQDI